MSGGELGQLVGKASAHERCQLPAWLDNSTLIESLTTAMYDVIKLKVTDDIARLGLAVCPSQASGNVNLFK